MNATKVHLKGDRNVTVQGLVQLGCLRNKFWGKVIHKDGEKEFHTGTVKMGVFLEFQSLVLILTSF